MSQELTSGEPQLPPPPEHHHQPRLVITPEKGWIALNLSDLWEYRELIGFLAWRDVASRYRQTLIGASWAVLQPLLMMAIFTIIFSRLARMPSDGLPYPLFSFAGMLPWQFFAAASTSSANSLVTSVNLLTKVYFPRLVIPIASVLPAAVDFSIAFIVLVMLMIYYGVTPTWHLLFFPAFCLLALSAALGLGIWLSALTIEYRDARHVMPVVISCWMYLSPVAYPSSMVPVKWKFLYSLNPMVAVIEGFRWSLLGKGEIQGTQLFLSIAAAFLLLASGAFYFRRMERSFADLI